MAQPDRSVPHASAHAAIFPKLEILGLTKLDLAEGKPQPSGMLFEVFKRGLQQRMAASGAPFKVLRISDCDAFGTKRAKDLRKLVQDFRWAKNGGLNRAI